MTSTSGAGEGSAPGGSNLPPRKETLGEMTLEEFLVTAVVVREDVQPIVRPNKSGDSTVN
ncbi:hypothetical protein GBA52_027272 [Prunus armeniaca]|nr:hypothetical protein GBA52_027272 [Prunus armeniaca]